MNQVTLAWHKINSIKSWINIINKNITKLEQKIKDTFGWCFFLSFLVLKPVFCFLSLKTRLAQNENKNVFLENHTQIKKMEFPSPCFLRRENMRLCLHQQRMLKSLFHRNISTKTSLYNLISSRKLKHSFDLHLLSSSDYSHEFVVFMAAKLH